MPEIMRRSRFGATITAAAALLFLAGTMPLSAAAAACADGLIERLRQGGYVVFLRHALTEPDQQDTGVLDRRERQRNLSEAGRLQAATIGAAIRELGIPVGKVLAGPVFRARDTAEIAFGADAVEVTMDLVADDYAGGGVGEMIAATRRRLAERPPAGTNTVLVGHRTPLELVADQPFPDSLLPEGAGAVFEPLGPDGFRFLGSIKSENWCLSK